ncbi:MAG: hypothetical protein Q8K46_07040 [Deltaproteobacteria bacterium]|nr:hypothetical protein [Deltaproteobacteria bacterium]
MMKKLTIDDSVIITFLLENEPRHEEGLRIWESIIVGRDVAIMPYSVKLKENDYAIMC